MAELQLGGKVIATQSGANNPVLASNVVMDNVNVNNALASATYPETIGVISLNHLYKYSVGKTKASFSATGSLQSWTVPNGVTSFLCKMWGAGGAGGNTGGWSYGSKGGGGGFSIALVPCTAGSVYYIVVGLPGQTTYAGTTTPRYGGGGGLATNTDNRYCGSGGGLAGLFTGNTPTQGNAVLIAGGGGGGGSSRMWTGNQGGAGGGYTGQHGDSPYDSRQSYAGGGGTQTSGGIGGTNTGTGSLGSALVGGYGVSSSYGGGGGGGFYGGGGGSYVEQNTMGGGGGGSGYINTSLTTYGASFTGFRDKPAMYEDPDLPKTFDGYDNWEKYACGGQNINSTNQYTNAGGGSAYVVIYY